MRWYCPFVQSRKGVPSGLLLPAFLNGDNRNDLGDCCGKHPDDNRSPGRALYALASMASGVSSISSMSPFSYPLWEPYSIFSC